MITRVAALADYENWAKLTLNKANYEYIAGSSHDGLAKAENESDFEFVKLKQRGMMNLSHFKGTETIILGHKIASPIGIAPLSQQQLIRPEGESASAQAAKELGLPYVLSGWSNQSLEEVAQSTEGISGGLGIKFFQLIPNLDISVRNSVLERVRLCPDYKAVVISCDIYGTYKSENDIKNEFSFPPHLTFGTYREYLKDSKDVAKAMDELTNKHSFKFEDIREIKKVSNLPVIIKGIMCKEDALLAIEHGADALWVSNTGGRTLDSAPSTISVLRAIAKAVKSANPRIEIYSDGGIRRGTDVVKALAFGADIVFVGRPVLWGLHQGGAQGVKEMLELLMEELKLAMILTTCHSLKDITEEKVIHTVRPKL